MTANNSAATSLISQPSPKRNGRCRRHASECAPVSLPNTAPVQTSTPERVQPAIAHEFTDTLQLHAEETLRRWLCNNVPGEVHNLFQDIQMLAIFNRAVERGQGQVLPHSNEEIGTIVANVVNGIAALGGVFTDGILNSRPRTPVAMPAIPALPAGDDLAEEQQP